MLPSWMGPTGENQIKNQVSKMNRWTKYIPRGTSHIVFSPCRARAARWNDCVSHVENLSTDKAYFNFKTNIPFKQSFLWTHSNSCAKDFAGSRQLKPPHFKFGKHGPQFRESKLLMRNKPDGSLVYLTRSCVVLPEARKSISDYK